MYLLQDSNKKNSIIKSNIEFDQKKKSKKIVIIVIYLSIDNLTTWHYIIN